MPKMRSLRNFRLSSTLGHIIQVEADKPFDCPSSIIDLAMAAGCVPIDAADLEFAEAVSNAQVEFTGGIRASTIYLAIEQVVKQNNTKNFDAGGMPKPDVISDRVGFVVGVAELRDLYQQYLSNKADGKEFEHHPNAQNIANVLAATTKAELIEMCGEFGIGEEQTKGENMAALRKLLLVKFSGVARD